MFLPLYTRKSYEEKLGVDFPKKPGPQDPRFSCHFSHLTFHLVDAENQKFSGNIVQGSQVTIRNQIEFNQLNPKVRARILKAIEKNCGNIVTAEFSDIDKKDAYKGQDCSEKLEKVVTSLQRYQMRITTKISRLASAPERAATPQV